MADQSLSIRLALTDGGKVKAELVDIGASGQKALERIRDAAQPASRGLQALDVAGTAVRGKMQEMAGSAGALGAGLTRLGGGPMASALSPPSRRSNCAICTVASSSDLTSSTVWLLHPSLLAISRSDQSGCSRSRVSISVAGE